MKERRSSSVNCVKHKILRVKTRKSCMWNNQACISVPKVKRRVEKNTTLRCSKSVHVYKQKV